MVGVVLPRRDELDGAACGVPAVQMAFGEAAVSGLVNAMYDCKMRCACKTTLHERPFINSDHTRCTGRMHACMHDDALHTGAHFCMFDM